MAVGILPPPPVFSTTEAKSFQVQLASASSAGGAARSAETDRRKQQVTSPHLTSSLRPRVKCHSIRSPVLPQGS
ncbi:hypothetical protein GUJ93_ZPchr0004g38143 [Zizania palustris]|uniref:Uncharacterized protein n=1 Tax=Zizania palustris TaxID=103762 RepID=A0A8J5SDA8_ZIZPA|nr:hypothetical protein GUJ93_ZPchr0004g38143 [Zizania palustris]